MLSIDLTGKRVLVAGVADDNGFGFAIAKAMAEAGAKVCVATWPPALNIFRNLLDRGKMDDSRRLSNGELLQFERVYPLDAAYDTLDDAPEEVRTSKRYKDVGDFSIAGMAANIERDFGPGGIDVVVHSLANGPEVKKLLVDTSRAGYLAAIGVSAYSLVSMVRTLGPLMAPGGSFLSLSYPAAERVVRGYGRRNSTAKAARYSAEARECGADGILVVTPYYNKPQVSGLVLHYRAVAEAAGGLPALVYNVPGRTGYNLLPRDLERLWEIPGIAGVKESSGNLSQIGEIARTLPEGKVLLAGDDALALPAIALGAEGLISVAGNAYPARMKALVEYALSGNRGEAGRVHAAMLPFMDALFLESNPAPLKTALFLMGLCGYCTRLPLVPASETTRARLAELIASFQARDARGVA